MPTFPPQPAQSPTGDQPSTPDQDSLTATAGADATLPRSYSLSRRAMLQAGAVTAAAGGASALLGASATPARAASAEAKAKAKWKNRRFRGLVKIDGTPQIAECKLVWPLHPRQVIVANEASQISYTNAWEAYKANFFGNEGQSPWMLGYIGVGQVVYVGEQVRRVKVGDRVVLGVTPQCGQCYNCIHNRPDMCQILTGDDDPAADEPRFTLVSDGRAVDGFPGGFSELMVATDDWVVPLFTDISPTALSLLGSVGPAGLAPPTLFAPVEPGSDVVVFGCGPIGLSAVNGAAIMGAGKIIAVDPISYRRDAALQVGATDVVDPSGKDDTLVDELREMTKGRTNRRYAGGRPRSSDGPDFILEATGSQEFDPSNRGIEPQPDPTGIREMLQIIDLCSSYGTIVSTGVRWSGGTIPLPVGQMGPGGKRWITGQYGGAGLTRDLPRMVTMMERNLYLWKKLVSSEYPLEDWKQAIDETAYRQTISNHLVFDPSPYLE